MTAIILVILKSLLFVVGGLFFSISYNFCKLMMKRRRDWNEEDKIVMFLITIANLCVFLALILIFIKDIINK